jgi:Lysyl oxidase
LSFCPNTWQKVRVGPDGPSQPVFPDYCSWNPFTLGMVYGVERDWAASLSGDSYRGVSLNVPKGRYAVDVSIGGRYTDMFDVEPANGSVSLSLVVKERRVHHHGSAGRTLPSGRGPRPAAPRVPTQRAPDPSTLPDLVPLPSWGIGVHRTRRGEFLAFGANIWIKGNGPMVVEGYRREGEPVMDAFQFFYRDGEPVGRAPVGQLAFDARHGHRHWHFKQFAGYQLLAADRETVVVSTKESFCLVPTDAIDLGLPHAEWRPGQVGLYSACGERDDLWIREVLPVGWGDTYYQYLPGQSFDITDLPNGTYFIKVIANPGRRLYEAAPGNNASLRKVIVRGKPGHRRVEVPPWHGIDTEGAVALRALRQLTG